ALALAGALLGLAAAQPVLEGATTRRVRTDAEAFFVLDTSRSMLARRAPGAPSRLARAKAVAEEVRRALPDVRAGLASITDRTLPHLFPSADEDVFRATLARAIGVDRPPPVHRLLARATQLEALADVPRQEFFSPSARARLLVVLTDGETLAGSGLRLGPLFRRPPAIGTVFVHVWGRDERVYAGGVAEPGYRADPAARATLERLAREVGGRVLAESEAGAAAGLARELLGRGPTVARGLRSWRVPLAPYLVAAGLLPLAVLLVRRGR
ncbi:MAG TPA: VWA domain-containing protein, partial [Gaiellaceae bacterium]|nr:VWA domain-containing protein [Gaiellaceae bacterium]